MPTACWCPTGRACPPGRCSFFSTRSDMDALGDSGGFRYYTNELTYVMGEGLRPWYGVQPRLLNKPLPLETLQGGLGSVSYDYADNPTFIFQQPHNHIGMQNMQRFVEGRRWLHTNMWTGDHNEAGNDRNEAAVGLQGPLFNQSSCVGCHVSNGRGVAPTTINQRLDTMAVKAAVEDANGQQTPHPSYGMAVQMNGRQSTGAALDWGTSVRVGRYGWKASKVSLRHQVANAALTDMSVTSPVYPNRDCLAGPAKCSATHKVERGISEEALKSITHYLALLAVPAQRSVPSGFPKGVTPLPYLDVNPTQVAAGAKVFANAKCMSCHLGEIRTGNGTEFAEVRNQLIRPYTDLLLHDMGPDLADNLVEGQASGSMWRTPALWGIGYTQWAAGKNGQVGYLHDSRARTLTEAILWHGGEATTSRQRFQALSKTDRDALLAFLGSL
eukprot:gene16252-34042_t